MEEDPNLFQDNNAKNKKIKQKQNKKQNQKIKKKKITPLKPYNVISIKTRNLLTNISFNGVTEEDLFNFFKLFFHPWRFFFDIDIQLTKNLNPFSIECKVQDKKARNGLYAMERMQSFSILQAYLQKQKFYLFQQEKCYLSKI